MSDPQIEEVTEFRERRDATENRQRLIAAAKTLFATQGVENISMREIARTAGVGQGTLYRHFADKGELCQALIKEDITAFQSRLEAIIGDTDSVLSPLERIDLLITEKLKLTDWHLPLLAAIEQESGGARRSKPFRGPFHTWTHRQVVALLHDAVTQGEVTDIDIDFTADVILATVAPPLFQFQRQERGYSVERIANEVRRLLIDRLRVDQETKDEGRRTKAES